MKGGCSPLPPCVDGAASEAAPGGFQFAAINSCDLAHTTSFQLLFSRLQNALRDFNNAELNIHASLSTWVHIPQRCR